jgi:hypothetical protein
VNFGVLLTHSRDGFVIDLSPRMSSLSSDWMELCRRLVLEFPHSSVPCLARWPQHFTSELSSLTCDSCSIFPRKWEHSHLLWLLRTTRGAHRFLFAAERKWSAAGKGKVIPVLYWAPRHEGVLWEWRYSSTHSLTSALDGGEWSASRPDRFTPRERAPGTH